MTEGSRRIAITSLTSYWTGAAGTGSVQNIWSGLGINHEFAFGSAAVVDAGNVGLPDERKIIEAGVVALATC